LYLCRSHRFDYPDLMVGVVLSAGRSSRMGTPKALLTLGGQTFLSAIVDAMRRGGCERVVVVTGPSTDVGAATIAEHALSIGASTATNPDADSHQIDSLRAALLAISGDPEGLIAAPVDAPGTTPEVVSELIAAIRAGAPIAIPTYGGRRGHPVAFGRPVLHELMETDLPLGARSVIHRHEGEVAELPQTDAGVLLDIDTPRDYQRLLQERE